MFVHAALDVLTFEMEAQFLAQRLLLSLHAENAQSTRLATGMQTGLLSGKRQVEDVDKDRPTENDKLETTEKRQNKLTPETTASFEVVDETAISDSFESSISHFSWPTHPRYWDLGDNAVESAPTHDHELHEPETRAFFDPARSAGSPDHRGGTLHPGVAPKGSHILV